MADIMTQMDRATRSVVEYGQMRERATRSVAGYILRHASFHCICITFELFALICGFEACVEVHLLIIVD